MQEGCGGHGDECVTVVEGSFIFIIFSVYIQIKGIITARVYYYRIDARPACARVSSIFFPTTATAADLKVDAYIPFAYDFRQRTTRVVGTYTRARVHTHAYVFQCTYILLYRRAINNCPRGGCAQTIFIYNVQSHSRSRLARPNSNKQQFVLGVLMRLPFRIFFFFFLCSPFPPPMHIFSEPSR